jgi:hypothetical protein
MLQTRSAFAGGVQSDAIQQKKDIPLAYLLPSTAYGLTMIVAVMCVAVAMFQRREVG